MNKKEMKKVSDLISRNELKLKSIQSEAEKKEFLQNYEQELESLIADIVENNNTWRSFDDILFELDEEIQKNIKKKCLTLLKNFCII